MKNLIKVFVAVLLVGISAPVGLAQAADNVGLHETIQSINSGSVANYDNAGNLVKGSIVSSRNQAPIYELKDGTFVPTGQSVEAGSNWIGGVTVYTKNGDDLNQYQQISNNQYLKFGDGVDVGVIGTGVLYTNN
ncbi:hypothetical protein [Companilactobacillus mishanensis]|uniref:Surface layer protein A domain-containing protein n=1 Tax=Companilactobacillus mishanensis TaxID=2486008 RepID=A0ABW9P8F7_9LACO|nr:hypothetical protein [Companilactobacillus mishanensis]MQS45546.1 hypothetical protein [Companilactobacillus mishanensis]